MCAQRFDGVVKVLDSPYVDWFLAVFGPEPELSECSFYRTDSGFHRNTSGRRSCVPFPHRDILVSRGLPAVDFCEPSQLPERCRHSFENAGLEAPFSREESRLRSNPRRPLGISDSAFE